jgi:hypothetical protein
MIQNSLDRLFEGMVETLSEVINPALEDQFARSQVSAMIEILRNLSTRVEWRADHLIGLVARIHEILQAALDLGIVTKEGLEPMKSLVNQPLPDPLDQEGLVESQRAHLWALSDIQKCLAELSDEKGKEVRSLIQKFIIWHLDRELVCLRTGMYKSRPKD